jgi:TonB family protein
MSENLDRLTYRNSPSSMAFAVKTILLSTLFGSCFFIIIPLTAKVDKPVEQEVTLRSVPEKGFLKKDLPKVELNKQNKEIKKEVVKVEPQIDIPQIQIVSAVPVEIKLSAIESPISLSLNVDFKTNMKFKVETIKAIGKPAEKPNKGITLVKPIKQQDLTDYNRVFKAGEIDQQAIRIKGGLPIYPSGAIRRGITGKVVINCTVNKEGQVTNAYIKTATPKGYFEEACIEALKNYFYKPAVKNGRKVSVQMQINFPFELTE